MSAAVVDCSAIAAVAFGEDAGEAIRVRLQGLRLLAPALMPFELAQVCATKIKRHPAEREAIHGQYVLALSNLPIEFEPVAFDELPDVAHRAGLSAYDAAYLWLAASRDAALVTLDEQLAEAYHQLARSC